MNVKENNLMITHPDIAKQWHLTKNGNLKPTDISAGSNKKVWWQCKKGHEWAANINNRTKGQGCPICANKKVLVGYNDLAATLPDVAREWHPTKNGDLKPTDVVAGNETSVWWICEHGHEWEATIVNRTRGSGCPYCAGKKVFAGFNDLATTHPDIAKQWNFAKNGDLKPTDISAGSNKKVWWICEHGHEWETSVNNRTKGSFCPICSGKKVLSGFNDLATTNPEIAKQWNFTKNGDLRPTDITAGSGKKVWWICGRGHEYPSRVVDRKQGYACPFCANQKIITGYNDLYSTHPEIAEEWHPTKNGTLKPFDVVFGTSKKVWWLGKCGHEWQATINSRSQGRQCPICSNRQILIGFNDFLTTNPELSKEWNHTKNGTLKPTDVTAGSGKKVWWKCEKGHEWKATIDSRVRGNGCPYCSCSGMSYKEQVVYYFIKKHMDEDVLYKQKIRNCEADIYIPKLKTVIEYDGSYWHKDKADKDKQKNNIFKELGLQVIRIREVPLPSLNHSSIDFLYNLKDEQEFETIISNIINLICGKNVKISIKDSETFLNSFCKKIEIERSISKTHPAIAKEWHFSKNGTLTPELVTAGNDKKVWWKCEKGHEWKAQINSRTRGSGCPYCSGLKVIAGINDLLTINPELAKEWHPTKNGNLKPADISAYCNKEVWWICSKGHEWKAPVHNRMRGRKCPFCSNKKVLTGYNDLQTTHPEIAKQWNFAKNGDLKPTDIIAGSHEKVWWICEHGHEWEARIYNRKNGKGCPYCSGRYAIQGVTDLATTHPEIAKEWHPTKNGDLKPTDVVAGSGKKVWWICNKGHEYERVIRVRRDGYHCPYCAKK